MKSFFIITSLILLIGIISPVPVLGKNEKAPGLMKKESMEMMEQEESSQTARPLEFKNGHARQLLDHVIGKNNGKEKIGSAQFEEFFRRLATDSSTLQKGLKGRKLGRIKIGSASPSAQLKRHAVEGVISSINGNMITLVHQIQQSRTYQIQVQPTTIVTQRGATPSATIQLAVGERVVVMGTPSAAGILLATRIHIIPGAPPGDPQPTHLPITGSPTAVPSPGSTEAPTTITPTSQPSSAAIPTEVPEPTASPLTPTP